MVSIALTGTIIWSACSPILEIAFVLGIHTAIFQGFLSKQIVTAVGIYLSRSKTVSTTDSKLLSTLIINIMYPCLLFTNVITGVSTANVASFGIMTIASIVITLIGFAFGFIVMGLTRPPSDFRYGTVMATAMGNYGDMVLAITLAVGNFAPFNAGDASKGVAYVAGFMCFATIFAFTVGYKLIGEDFKHMPKSVLAVNTTPISEADDLAIVITDESLDTKNVDTSSLKYWLKTCFNPNTVATLLGLLITLIPVLRNLFYTESTATETATSQPLAFIFKALQLVGNAGVPIGLLNVGSALGRLEFKKFAPIRVITGIALCRLIVMPILGVVLVQVLVSHGIIDGNDKMMQFVMMMEASIPTASTTVYLTQFWHPRGEADAMASVVVVQYAVAFVTMTLSLAIILSLLA
ncbi:Protein M3 [Physocladia obscura]|uniref:Protein M3 n=1 Tax=Physocladia obscura TaxID=109957 RepID=A0AAD5XJF8_9FUNG|nr:Protein M3 [Physocladia obscura]